MDYEIPLKYGVDQCIGDTLGPGGVFRGAAAHPGALMEIAEDMRGSRHARTRIMLNYANPMAAICSGPWARVAGVPFVGLCHGVQTTST